MYVRVEIRVLLELRLSVCVFIYPKHSCQKTTSEEQIVAFLQVMCNHIFGIIFTDTDSCSNHHITVM